MAPASLSLALIWPAMAWRASSAGSVVKTVEATPGGLLGPLSSAGVDGVEGVAVRDLGSMFGMRGPRLAVSASAAPAIRIVCKQRTTRRDAGFAAAAEAGRQILPAALTAPVPDF